MSENLKAGEFYGQVPQKKLAASAVLSEIVHRQKIALPAHSHELASFTLLLDGSYAETFGRKKFSYRPLTVWWHPSDIFHEDEIGMRGGRFFTVEIQPRGMENLRRFAKTPEMFFEKHSALVWLACRLYHEFKNWQVCSELVAEGITLEMLAHAARKTNPIEKSPPAWLARVAEKLNDEFAENFSTEDLAAEANVHPVYLATVFRRFYRETIGEYVQKLRVARAAKMLFDKEIPLSEIAYATGFSDQSHFTRVFKRYVGVTPGAFRATLDSNVFKDSKFKL
jgi:AraC family transcriptional regulator